MGHRKGLLLQRPRIVSGEWFDFNHMCSIRTLGVDEYKEY